MLNKQYSTPLHGVELFLNKTKTTQRSSQIDGGFKLPYGLEIFEGKVSPPDDSPVIWQLSDKGARYHSHIRMYHPSEQLWIMSIDCEGKGKFAITPNSITIDWDSSGTDSSHYFQTLAIALWLELKSVLCIHANAVVIDGKCIALIAPSGMGKSTLSAFLQETGACWLTDDMLALHQCKHTHKYIAYPSWAKARIWPDSMQHVLKKSAMSPNKVHERFDKLEIDLPVNDSFRGFELHAIYALNRNGAELASLKKNPTLMTNDMVGNGSYLTNNRSRNQIIGVNNSLALMALLQNSILGDAYSALCLEHTRLKQMSDLLSSVSMKQIHYESTFNGLKKVHELLKSDLKGSN